MDTHTVPTLKLGFLFLSIATLATSVFMLGVSKNQMMQIGQELVRQRDVEQRLIAIESRISVNTERITKLLIHDSISP